MTTWAIVLAGGDGTRLAGVASEQYGYPRAKQFCDFDGTGTLLARTLRRTRLLVPEGRTIVSIARRHRAEAAETLAAFPQATAVEQPCNRGTTPGILLPLLHVLREDPAATVLVCPSDHHVACDGIFAIALATARDVARSNASCLAMLAAAPDAAEDGYGWLLPAAGDRGFAGVAAFCEKPPLAEVPNLVARGALINTFVFGVRALALARALAAHVPAWWTATRQARDVLALDAVYEALPARNLSTDVLERIPDRLRIVPLRDAGWSDIGTPQRLAAVVQGRRATEDRPPAP